MIILSVLVSDTAVIVSGVATIITTIGAVYTRFTLMKIKASEAMKAEHVLSLEKALATEKFFNERLLRHIDELELRIEALEKNLSNQTQASNVKSNRSRRPKA